MSNKTTEFSEGCFFMTFQMWSFFHFFFILSPFIFAFLFYFLFKRYDEKKLRSLGIIFTLIGIALLVGRNIEIYLKAGEFNPEVIPLQICHFANFVLLFAFLLRSNTLFAIAFCFNLPAAFLSIVFANGLMNYPTLISWQAAAYIFGHMLIVGVVIWAFLNKMVHLNIKVVHKAVGIILILFLLSIVVNNLFEKWMSPHPSNYFYTMTPEQGTPLELFYSLGNTIFVIGLEFNPIYIITLLFVGYSVVLLFYGIYSLLKFSIKQDQKNTRLISSHVPISY